MRGTKALLARLLVALALFVAALPLRAGATVCAPPSAKAKGRCAMPCCEKRPMPSCKASPLSSGGEGVSRAVHRRSASCGCETEGPLNPFVAPPKATLPAFDPSALVAILPSRPGIPAQTPLPVEPGIVGLDSGPPPSPPGTAEASRAPPVRA